MTHAIGYAILSFVPIFVIIYAIADHNEFFSYQRENRLYMSAFIAFLVALGVFLINI